jgi:group I intron endonuclease
MKICEGPLVPNSIDHISPVIYLLKNKTNGKIYIGSSGNPHRRYMSYSSFCNGTKKASRGIEQGLRFYGLEGFDFYILEYVSRIEFLLDREQWWLDSVRPFGENGYNWAKVASRNNSPRMFTDEQKARRSQLSRLISRQTLERRIGRLRKPVYRLDPISNEILDEFPSAAAASKAYGKAVRRACNPKMRCSISHGFRWAYKEDYLNGNFVPYLYTQTTRAVKQLSLDNQLIKTWSSISEAAQSVGANPCSIRQCCERKSRKSFGFKWEYVNKPGCSRQT